MLYNYGLINMNNRLYDPIVGRFLAVDNYVQDASGTQFYNRYTYALNNPLKYSDPRGEAVHIAVFALVGGLVNVIDQGLKGNITSWGEGFAYFGVGAAAGLAVGAGHVGAARLITAGGNKVVQIATGKFSTDNIDSPMDIALTVLDIGTDLLGPDLTKGVTNGLSKIAANRAAVKAAEKAIVNNSINVFGSTAAEKVGGKLAEGIAFNALAKEGIVVASKAVDRGARIAASTVGKFGVKAFTRRNFRNNLAKLTGQNPANSQAHHIFPHNFATRFDKIGINVNNPIFGTWWETTPHLRNAYQYNQRWLQFFDEFPSASIDKTLDFGKSLMGEYGNFNIFF